jgi:predicted AAA+ superfamily ATPase
MAFPHLDYVSLELPQERTWATDDPIGFLERDVRQIQEVRDLALFQQFLRLCAGRTGQLPNAASFSADVGVSGATVRGWLSILHASYIITLLPPYHTNLGKRLVKSPSLDFLDVGLAPHLIGIQDPSQVATPPLRGALPRGLALWAKQAGDLVDKQYLVTGGDASGSQRGVTLLVWRDLAKIPE